MTAVLLATFEPHSPEWYALRSEGLGSSDIAAIVGASKYGTPYSVWVDKCVPRDPDEGDNQWQEWGKTLEPVIAAKFARNHPEFRVAETGTWAVEERPWQRANPDRLLVDPFGDVGRESLRGVLEIKTAARDSAWEDGVPATYEAQVTWQADVLDVDHVWVAVLIGGSDYREYRVDVSEFDKARLRNIGENFWLDHVVGFTPPPLDGSQITFEAVQRATPPPTEASQAIDGALADEFIAAKASLDAAQEVYNLLKSRMLIVLGDAKHGVRADGTKVALRKHYEKDSLQGKALKADHPDIHAQYLKTSWVSSIEVAHASRPSKDDA
jgi:putative phage-type endonuclease